MPDTELHKDQSTRYYLEVQDAAGEWWRPGAAQVVGFPTDTAAWDSMPPGERAHHADLRVVAEYRTLTVTQIGLTRNGH